MHGSLQGDLEHTLSSKVASVLMEQSMCLNNLLYSLTAHKVRLHGRCNMLKEIALMVIRGVQNKISSEM